MSSLQEALVSVGLVFEDLEIPLELRGVTVELEILFEELNKDPELSKTLRLVILSSLESLRKATIVSDKFVVLDDLRCHIKSMLERYTTQEKKNA